MSRHTVPPKSSGTTVVVGWDNPLQSYFAQVIREQDGGGVDDDDDPVLLWLGASHHEHLTPDSLAEPLRPYADLDQELLAQLRSDRAEAAERKPSHLQSQMQQLLRQPPFRQP